MAGVYSAGHTEVTGCCIHTQGLVVAPGIAVLEHLLEDTEADKLTAGLGKNRWELIHSHRRAAAPQAAPGSGPKVLVLVDTGLRRGLAGRRADFESSLYTASVGRAGAVIRLFLALIE